MPRRKNPRDISKLSGKPLSETLEPSLVLNTATEPWVTSQDLMEDSLSFIPKVVHEMTFFLLANPNLKSSVLFRADILYDSEGTLPTLREKEPQQEQILTSPISTTSINSDHDSGHVDPLPAREVEGFTLTRTVVRRMIPRNPTLDRPLDQTCHFYESTTPMAEEASLHRFLAIYIPHVSSKEDMPYYHPALRSLAILYDYQGKTTANPGEGGTGVMSVHALLYSDEPVSTRLERTLHMLLGVQIRIARGTRLTKDLKVTNHNPLKDNVIPQHLIQDTYTRLKSKYSTYLCKNWVETTDPTKHVFEDLAVTAFLIELWRIMYGYAPADERKQPEIKAVADPDTDPDVNTDANTTNASFPGFVDVACGNGVLVYILLQEGYSGWGFDARRRKTWSIFPDSVQERLREEIYIPKPFADELELPTSPSTSSVFSSGQLDIGLGPDVKAHTGTFSEGIFIISNHADELTLWTPLLATLLSPASPSPFLAIPCCSHSLSGARYRYPPPSSSSSDSHPQSSEKRSDLNLTKSSKTEDQPATGDLKALRKAKQDAANPDSAGFVKSMYGSLTAKTVSVAEEVGYAVEKTLLRIPSTRNIGIIGGRKVATDKWRARLATTQIPVEMPDTRSDQQHGEKFETEVFERAMDIVTRECMLDGGIGPAANIWVERAKGLHKGQGMGAQHGS